MTPELAIDLNRFAILVNFLSFFLVAPEILGQERLERLVANATGNLVAYALSVLGAGVFFIGVTAVTAATYWTNQPLAAIVSPTIWVTLMLLLPLIVFGVIYYGTHDRLSARLVAFFAANPKRRRWIFRLGLAMFAISSAIQFMIG